METKLIRENNTNEKVNHFLINWHKFTFDYWWRKKYNIAFGSPQHREMNFIDMFIEYKEEVLFKGESPLMKLKEGSNLDNTISLEKIIPVVTMPLLTCP